MTTEQIVIWLIPLPPLVAFFVILLFTNRSKALSHTIGVGAAALSFLGSMFIFMRAFQAGAEHLGENPFTSSVPWLPLGDGWFRIGILIDPLSAAVLFFVAITIFMIFLYSVGYQNYGQPKGDHDRPGLPPHGATVTDVHGRQHRVPSVEPMYSRFFAFIGLFAFGMYTLVISDNLLTLFVLCSYLLIGFWYAKPSARAAMIKAFITTRVGDVFMLLGIAYLYSAAGTLNFREIFYNADLLNRLAESSSGFLGLSVAGLIGILLFIGTIGKSAQWPLHVWLPDAMEGPTPVSAMIHAATMVSAGVYMVIRMYPLLSAGMGEHGPLTSPMMVMTIIGSFTALFSATIAVAQNDIKRVLAYSTISQLGYMIAALGIGAYVAAAFHLISHAFFKALLPQDMFNMGGLRKKMPITFWTFLLGGFALSGFPLFTAGFWSKDEIFADAFAHHQYWVLAVLGLAALLTAFYTMRQITLTFLGEPRTKAAEHAQETHWTMTVPLMVLAFFAVTYGWAGIPEKFPLIGGLTPNFFHEYVKESIAVELAVIEFSFIPLLISIIVSLGGLTLGWLVYRGVKAGEADPLEKLLGPVYKVLHNKYYFDELYDFLFIKPAYWVASVFTSQWMDRTWIDGILHFVARLTGVIGNFLRDRIDMPIVNGSGDMVGETTKKLGDVFREIQTGKVQQYMILALVSIAAFSALFYYLLVALR